MVNEEPEREPPLVPEDMTPMFTGAQRPSRECEQPRRTPTVVRIPPRERDRLRSAAIRPPRTRRYWSTGMSLRPPPAATTTSSRSNHLTKGREIETMRLRHSSERTGRATVGRSTQTARIPSTPPRSSRVPPRQEVRRLVTRPRHAGSSRHAESSCHAVPFRHAGSSRDIANCRVSVPAPSTARVVTARDAGGRTVRPRDLLRVPKAVRQGLREARLLSRRQKKTRRYRVWHANGTFSQIRPQQVSWLDGNR